MPETSFREAMDLLCLTALEAAELFGVPAQHVRQWRLDDGNAGYRPPPVDWRRIFLPLARKRGDELRRLIKALEAGVGEAE